MQNLHHHRIPRCQGCTSTKIINNVVKYCCFIRKEFTHKPKPILILVFVSVWTRPYTAHSVTYCVSHGWMRWRWLYGRSSTGCRGNHGTVADCLDNPSTAGDVARTLLLSTTNMKPRNYKNISLTYSSNAVGNR